MKKRGLGTFVRAKLKNANDGRNGNEGGNVALENTLFYGDNLDILRHSIKDESVDLIYLDPPFNSARNYNVLFKEKGSTHETGKIVR